MQLWICFVNFRNQLLSIFHKTHFVVGKTMNSERSFTSNKVIIITENPITPFFLTGLFKFSVGFIKSTP